MTKIFLNYSNTRSAALALHAHTCNIIIWRVYYQTYVPTRFAARKSRDSQRCSLTGAVANTGPVVVVGAHLAKTQVPILNLCVYVTYQVHNCIPCVCITPWRRRDHRISVICRCLQYLHAHDNNLNDNIGIHYYNLSIHYYRYLWDGWSRPFNLLRKLFFLIISHFNESFF